MRIYARNFENSSVKQILDLKLNDFEEDKTTYTYLFQAQIELERFLNAYEGWQLLKRATDRRSYCTCICSCCGIDSTKILYENK